MMMKRRPQPYPLPGSHPYSMQHISYYIASTYHDLTARRLKCSSFSQTHRYESIEYKNLLSQTDIAPAYSAAQLIHHFPT